MPFKPLAPEIVPLIHHIELTKAGWGLRLTEQLVIVAACSSGKITSINDMRLSIKTQFGVHATEADVRRAVATLTSNKTLIQMESGRFKVSETKRAALDQQKAESLRLEQAARTNFEQILSDNGIEITDKWNAFHYSCLRPIVTELGARIYHILSGEPPTEKENIGGTSIHTWRSIRKKSKELWGRQWIRSFVPVRPTHAVSSFSISTPTF